MHKLILIFHQPPDLESFEDRWSNDFVPVVEKMPGIRRVAVSRVMGGLSAHSDILLIHEIFFDDRRALEAGMSSEMGRQAGEALVKLAGERVEVLFGQHLQEDR